MRDWWPRLIVLALLAAVIGVPFLFRQTEARQPDEQAGERLVIFTPHNEQIRYEFATGFNAWRRGQGRSAVEFDWRSSGGTSDLRRVVLDQFRDAARDGREDGGIGADLFFGGGPYDHDKLADGVRIGRDGKPVTVLVVEPAPLSPQDLTAIYGEAADIGGAPLYRKDLRWLGTTLSSFGIVYNRDVLAMLKTAEPTTWSDLAEPPLRGWVGVADPGHSGSATTTYDAILRRLGWHKGWWVLRRVFANARYFASMSSKVPVDVTNGDVAAGMCIDFYGRFQSGAIAGADLSEGAAGRVGYVDPPFMTAISADPISLLRGAPNRATAVEFIAWVLSPQGQRLWQRRVGEPDGPRRFELRRLPISPDLYRDDERRHWTDPEADPFAIAKPFAPGMPSFFNAVETVSQAIAIDVRDDLVAAWDAICHNADHPRTALRYKEMLRLFDQMPEALTIAWPDSRPDAAWQLILQDANDPDHAAAANAVGAFMAGLSDRWKKDRDAKVADRLAWTRFFRDNYRRIVEIAGKR